MALLVDARLVFSGERSAVSAPTSPCAPPSLGVSRATTVPATFSTAACIATTVAAMLAAVTTPAALAAQATHATRVPTTLPTPVARPLR